MYPPPFRCPLFLFVILKKKRNTSNPGIIAPPCPTKKSKIWTGGGQLPIMSSGGETAFLLLAAEKKREDLDRGGQLREGAIMPGFEVLPLLFFS